MEKSTPLPQRAERGQALVLLAMSMVALIAFTALAVDGTNSYSQRRAAQNAADGAALAATYDLRLQHPLRRDDDGDDFGATPLASQRRLLVVINEAAQAHGIPDTNGNPGDHINGNVEAYFYSRLLGRVNPLCRVGSCPIVPPDSTGVQVIVRKPFETFFAGVVGWKQATVGANATAVIHHGATGNNNEYWAIFAEERQNTSGWTAYIYGLTTQIIGNVHSNGGVKLQERPVVTEGQITYFLNCVHCDSSVPPQPAPERIDPTYPSFSAYRELAELAGPTQNYSRDVKLCTGIGCDGLSLGSLANPLTFIDGNLDATGSNLTLDGLIFVTGDILMSGLNISTRHGVTLVAGGSITVSPGAVGLNLYPYQETLGRYPLLDPNRHVALFFSNRVSAIERAAVSVTGRSHVLTGAVIAPNGDVTVSGTGIVVIGSLIGNTVDVRGTFNRVVYNRDFFPPQPDRIELME